MNAKEVVEIIPGAIWYSNLYTPVQIDKVENGQVYYTSKSGNPGLGSGSHTINNFRYYYSPKLPAHIEPHPDWEI